MAKKRRKLIIGIFSGFCLLLLLLLLWIIPAMTKAEQQKWSKELCEAIDNNDVATIELLLADETKDVNAYAGNILGTPFEMIYERPIETACFRSHYDVVKMLIDRGANVDGEEFHDPVASTIEDFDKDDYRILLLPS